MDPVEQTARVVDNKRNTRLSIENNAGLQGLKEQKEIGRFLLPDAPERKQQRKPSPPRSLCPLVPGTPETPASRKRRYWEVNSGQSTSAVDVVPSQVKLEDPWDACFSPASEVDVVPPQVKIEGPCISPASEVDVVPPQVKIEGPCISPASEEQECIEDEVAEWERYVGHNAGSDVEEELDIDIDLDRQRAIAELAGAPLGATGHRYVGEFPAGTDDLTPDLLEHLNELDARDDVALRGLVSNDDMLSFNWNNEPGFAGKREEFIGPAGPTFETDGMTPLDIFERIWDETIMTQIVDETNRYASQAISSSVFSRTSRISRWQNIRISDLWSFYAVIMMQSFISNPVEKEYWYPRYSYLRIGDFNHIMPYNKFLLIKKFLHFVDNTSVSVPSKLVKIIPIIDHLNRKFSSLYLPEQNIALDESLLLWKGRLNFVQLISNKAARVGIKSYELCESRTGYLWKFEIYAGKGSHLDEGHDVERAANVPEGATSQIVYRLMRPLLNKGHTLVMDNFYNSPLLSRTLKAQKTDTMGTLRLNRQFVPSCLRNKTKNNMRTGEIAFSHTEDLSVLVWRDSNLVSLISTFHDVEIGGAEKHGVCKYKPKVLLDYNLSMGGVDKKDQLLQSFPVERIRNAVWYKKLFRRLLNVSIHNAYVIYSHKAKVSYREFRMQLADQILRKYNRPPSPTPSRSLPNLVTGHFPLKAQKSRCKQCAKVKKDCRTVWVCEACKVPLCVNGCFKNYHLSQTEEL